jgi:glutamate-1-semialdehyde aminotransferase
MVYHPNMKRHAHSLPLLLACLIVLLDAFWLPPRAVHAQGTLKVYVQQAKDKHWTDIQGTEIVGFSCATTSVTNADCFIASR